MSNFPRSGGLMKMIDSLERRIYALERPSDTGWIEPTVLGHGWVSSTQFGYRKVGRVVYLRGTVTNGTPGQAWIFLPPGLRPGQNMNFPSFTNGPSATWIDVRASDGAVYNSFGAPGFLVCDGITFLAEG